MKLFWLKLTALAFGLSFLAGCNTTLKLTDITVNVIDIRPLSATPLETQAELTLRYINGNLFSLAVEGTRHKLYLNGDYVGEVVSHEPVGLPKLGTTTQKVTIYLKNLALLQKLRDMASTKTISYRLKSSIQIAVSDEHQEVDTVSTGQLDIGALLGSSPH